MLKLTHVSREGLQFGQPDHTDSTDVVLFDGILFIYFIYIVFV